MSHVTTHNKPMPFPAYQGNFQMEEATARETVDARLQGFKKRSDGFSGVYELRYEKCLSDSSAVGMEHEKSLNTPAVIELSIGMVATLESVYKYRAHEICAIARAKRGTPLPY